MRNPATKAKNTMSKNAKPSPITGNTCLLEPPLRMELASWQIRQTACLVLMRLDKLYRRKHNYAGAIL